MRIFAKIAPITLIVGGIGLIAFVGLPMIHYEIIALRSFKKPELISPLVQRVRTVSAGNFDLTKASNWFVNAPVLPEVPTKVQYYNLSIPKLKIKKALVEIGGDDLSKSLIHYKGTALPGQQGNAVVFGHSTLPQLYDPKNYLTIFSLLPTLERGDIVRIDYDGITYFYKIEKMFEVNPDDVEILIQRFDDAYLTLVTCVPPGTYLRRLVVQAKLLSPEATLGRVDKDSSGHLEGVPAASSKTL